MPEAQYFLAEADAILSQVNRVRHTMRGLAGGQTSELRVAAMPGPVSLIFPRFIAAHVKEADGISISIQARTSNQIAELTRAQSIDFGFADASDHELSENLFRSVVITADCPVAIPAGHPLAQKTQISISDLHDQRMGTLPVSHRQSIDLAARFTAEGARLRATIKSQSFLPILYFVAAGQCCSVLDPLSIFLVAPNSPMVEGVTVRPMSDPVRYRYAIFSPAYRPISVIARHLLEAWQKEVMSLLDDAGYSPRLET